MRFVLVLATRAIGTIRDRGFAGGDVAELLAFIAADWFWDIWI